MSFRTFLFLFFFSIVTVISMLYVSYHIAFKKGFNPLFSE